MDFAELAVGPDPQLPLETYRRRRERLAEWLGAGRSLVVATNPVTTYSNDVEHVFRPHSDFWYLTGFREPRALLVVEGGTGDTTLFLQGRRPEAEVWTGRRLGLERAPDVLGVDRVLDHEKDLGRLKDILGGGAVAVAGHAPAVAQRLGNLEVEVSDGSAVLAEMRIRKEPEELSMLARAAELGVAAMRHAAALIRPGARECEVEAALLAHYRAAGSTGPGYPPIVGAGANAAILHYIENNGTVRDGDMVLVDAGCEWGYYNSDITRTYPAGDVSSQAREVYDLVLRAHQGAMAEVRPGNRLGDPHEAAVQVLAEGLSDLGILDMDAEAIVAEKAYHRFFMHGTSHLLGLDVHDVGSRRSTPGKGLILEEGMVLTVEPGLYFNTDFTECPAGLEGVGIRIEDDVVVGEEGARVLTAGLPTSLDEVEGLLEVRP